MNYSNDNIDLEYIELQYKHMTVPGMLLKLNRQKVNLLTQNDELTPEQSKRLEKICRLEVAQ